MKVNTEEVKIYFDLDGVLADFNRGVRELCHFTPLDQSVATKEQEAALWDAVRTVDHFYDKLELMPGATEMFDAVYSRYGGQVEILSGIPKPHRQIPTPGEDKTAWVHRVLSPDIKVNIVFKEEKLQKSHGPEDILIDDLARNINDWNEHGGNGILHTSVEETMARLREIGVLD